MTNRLSHALISAVVAIPAGALITGMLLTLAGGYGEFPETFGHFIGGTAAIFVYGSLLAIPFVLFYGVPLYALLLKFGWANFWTSVLFGGLPGVAWVLWANGWWFDPVLVEGVAVAVIYHSMRIRLNKGS